MAACETNEKAVDDGGNVDKEETEVEAAADEEVLGAQFERAAINALPDEEEDAGKDDDSDEWSFIVNGGA
jgi:hypothetical protein